jgi:predicted DsbA family dithiol-disulfide isomerase
MKQNIKIDIVSDVVCPWCYIGKRRLEKALEALRDTYTFALEYHPFELNPEMPVTGVDQKEYFAQKFGSESRYRQLTEHVTQVAAQEGLRFDFSRQKVAPNTRKAHILLQLAKLDGRQPELMEALFKAYFTDGVDLSNDENLVSLAVNAGLDKLRVYAVLNDPQAAEQISGAERELSKLGISGVPFYIINNQYGVSGAQPTETFINAFTEIGKEISTTAASCDVASKNC